MRPTATFHTSRLVFRAVNADDKDDVRIVKELHADPITWVQSMGGVVMPISNTRAESMIKNGGSLLYVFVCLQKSPEEPTVAGTVIGDLHLDGLPPMIAHWQRATFGISLDSKYQGKGYGTEALEWLLEQAFYRFNLNKVSGECWSWNEGARALYKKVGFVEEGVRLEHVFMEGQYWDEICLGMLRKNWQAQREMRLTLKDEAEKGKVQL